MNKCSIVCFVFLMLPLISCHTDDDGIDINGSVPNSIYYEIDLGNIATVQQRQFSIACVLNQVRPTNDLFQFAATIPGVYAVYNYGQYVDQPVAKDGAGQRLTVERVGGNQFRIANYPELKTLDYEVTETWETPVPSDYPGEIRGYYPAKMAATVIDNHYALIQPAAVFGRIDFGGQDIFLRIKVPKNWRIETSASEVNGIYHFTSYDELYDTPILIGDPEYLTFTQFTFNNKNFTVSAYSPTKTVKAKDLISPLMSALQDEQDFVDGSLDEEYHFIFVFGESQGALEHLHSSVYTVSEEIVNQKQNLEHIVAHEYFHRFSPLSVRSEVISDFRYNNPTGSRHVWFYEGVTEWAAMFMRYRGESLPLTNDDDGNLFLFLSRRFTLSTGSQYSLSLAEMGTSIYTAEGHTNFPNAYYRASIVATLLDIRLLKLSNGVRGLREVILELRQRYDKEHPFSEADFFSEIVERTYPEITDFINSYIINNDPLPMQEYFSWIGVDFFYDPANSITLFSRMPDPTAEQDYLFRQWSRNY